MSHGKVTLTHIVFRSLKRSLCVFTKHALNMAVSQGTWIPSIHITYVATYMFVSMKLEALQPGRVTVPQRQVELV